MTRSEIPSSDCTRSPDEISTIGFSSKTRPEQIPAKLAAAAGGVIEREAAAFDHLTPNSKMTVLPLNRVKSRACVTLNGSGIQLAVGPQPLWLRNHNSGPAQRIIIKRLATSPHDPLGITDSTCKNQSVVVSVQYGPFNPFISIRSTTIGKSRVARDPIAMHTSWRSNSDIASVTSIGYPRMSASGESSTTMHRLLHASGSHPIPTPYDSRDLHAIIPSDSIGYPRMSASGESSTTMHRLLHASGSHPIPTPGDPK
ncbi:L-ascorbate oxidase [Dorcoceras hygrometricum]|uniref:L-ascorbate oxidase n=1 Tax=Dorcoceras hygrometricum TaxID=472368 RepID=A0A2Z7C3R9_9LAMI|nr:L-ascorbate oxidase [Dorcoceras hygrometricum]